MAAQSGGNDQAKRERRLARKAAEQEAARKAAVRRQVLNLVAFFVLGAVLGLGVWMLMKPDPEIDGVEQPEDLGRRHLAAGESYEYDHPAPTSGPHSLQAARCGTYTDFADIPLIEAVHALEHGAVIMWHDPELDLDEVGELRDVAAEHDSHVIVAPNPGIDHPVVVTAWNRRASFDTADDPGIAEFVETYRQRGPEQVDCPA